MSTEELKAIAERHEATREDYANFAAGYGSITYCNLCRAKWPCDAFRAASITLAQLTTEPLEPLRDTRLRCDQCGKDVDVFARSRDYLCEAGHHVPVPEEVELVVVRRRAAHQEERE